MKKETLEQANEISYKISRIEGVLKEHFTEVKNNGMTSHPFEYLPETTKGRLATVLQDELLFWKSQLEDFDGSK